MGKEIVRALWKSPPIPLTRREMMASRCVTRSTARRCWKDLRTPTKRNFPVPEMTMKTSIAIKFRNSPMWGISTWDNGSKTSAALKPIWKGKEVSGQLERGENEKEKKPDQQTDGHLSQDEKK